jgi:serine/threonine protein kinase
MGVVYEVKNRLTGERLALKMILPEFGSNPNAARRFLQEVHTARRLRHPYIITIQDVGKDGDSLFFTMEYLRGMALRNFMRERGRLPLDVAAPILRQLCDALEYAHQLMVHRDLSPENVMVLPDGSIKLLDFGLARMVDRDTMTVTGAALGKAYYMSPEQRKDSAHVDARTDIYALGVMLFEMLTGEFPFGHQRLRDLRPDVPAACDELIARCLAPVDQRLKTAAEFRQGLNACFRSPAPQGAEAAEAIPQRTQIVRPGEAPRFEASGDTLGDLADEFKTIRELQAPGTPASERGTWTRRLLSLAIDAVVLVAVMTFTTRACQGERELAAYTIDPTTLSAVIASIVFVVWGWFRFIRSE